MISLKGVSKSYKGITIFEDVNITFMPNKWNFIEGVNGSGKSVLLKLICGFSKPDTGIVTVDDYIIGQDYDFIQNAGICINSPDFFNNLSGMDNLLEIAKIKIKSNSSSGGHNGIKNIIENINSKNFIHLKVGISNNKNMDTKDYVLGQFSKDEVSLLEDKIETVNSIITDFINGYSCDKLMMKYNGVKNANI